VTGVWLLQHTIKTMLVLLIYRTPKQASGVQMAHVTQH